VYGSRETPIDSVDGSMIADRARRFGHRDVHYVPDKENLPEELEALTDDGDVVLMMGAGDIWRYSRVFVDRLSDTGKTKPASEQQPA